MFNWQSLRSANVLLQVSQTTKLSFIMESLIYMLVQDLYRHDVHILVLDTPECLFIEPDITSSALDQQDRTRTEPINIVSHVAAVCLFAHLMSPTSGCFFFCFSSRLVRYCPTRSALPCRSSFTITSNTARPMAHDTGLPPNWEIQNPHTDERLDWGQVHHHRGNQPLHMWRDESLVINKYNVQDMSQTVANWLRIHSI